MNEPMIPLTATELKQCIEILEKESIEEFSVGNIFSIPIYRPHRIDSPPTPFNLNASNEESYGGYLLAVWKLDNSTSALAPTEWKFIGTRWLNK